MKIITVLLGLALSITAYAQKDIQKKYFKFDMGLSYTGAIPLEFEQSLYGKVGYDFGLYYEHEFNSGKSFQIGLGHSLNGFAIDTRFKNVFHAYNLSLPILYGRTLEENFRFYIGINPTYAIRCNYSEVITTLKANKVDMQFQLGFEKDINRFLGVNFTARLGVLDIHTFSDTYTTNYSAIVKCYLRILGKRNVAFIAN